MGPPESFARHDPELFVPFGKGIEGLAVANALNAGWSEVPGAGTRSAEQRLLFERGNLYLLKQFPRLNDIICAELPGYSADETQSMVTANPQKQNTSS